MARARAAVGVLLAVTLLPWAARGDAGARAADRLYLLAADTDYLYWGADADDPELDLGSARWTCRYYPPSPAPCDSANADGVGIGYRLDFMPATVLHEPAVWSSARPLRFRLALEVSAVDPFTVHLQVGTGADGRIHTSPPAAEVQPGIWEGTVGGDGALDGATGNSLSVFVGTGALLADLTLRTRGASFLELPEPITASAVPQLIADDTHAPDPNGFQSAFRSFRFRDRDWTAYSFDGDLLQTRRFDLSLERDAVAVLAWIDLFDEPFAYRLARDGDADPDTITPSFRLRLLRDGEMISDGFSDGEMGYGVDSLATLDVGAGPLTLEVERARPTPQSEATYGVHLLALHGARTLDSYRVRFAVPARDVTPAARAVAGVCPPAIGLLPLTTEAVSVHADLDWHSVAPSPFTRWTPKFHVPGLAEFPCGELGNGDRVRVTVPGPRLAYFGAVPARDSTFVSWRDTTFELEVRFTYTSPGAA